MLVQNSAGRLFLGSTPALSSSPSRVFAVYATRWKRADRSQVPWRLSRGGTEAHHHNQPSLPLVLLPARGPSPCPGFTGGFHHAGSLALPLGAFQHRPDDGPVKNHARQQPALQATLCLLLTPSRLRKADSDLQNSSQAFGATQTTLHAQGLRKVRHLAGGVTLPCTSQAFRTGLGRAL